MMDLFSQAQDTVMFLGMERLRYSDQDLAAFLDVLNREEVMILNAPLGIFPAATEEHRRQALKNVTDAKLRIANKTFGICRVSGELISRRWLALVPHASLGVNLDRFNEIRTYCGLPAIEVTPQTNDET